MVPRFDEPPRFNVLRRGGSAPRLGAPAGDPVVVTKHARPAVSASDRASSAHPHTDFLADFLGIAFRDRDGFVRRPVVERTELDVDAIPVLR